IERIDAATERPARVNGAAIVVAQVAAAASLVSENHDALALAQHRERFRLVIHIDTVAVDPAHDVLRLVPPPARNTPDVRVGQGQERLLAAIAASRAPETEKVCALGLHAFRL